MNIFFNRYVALNILFIAIIVIAGMSEATCIDNCEYSTIKVYAEDGLSGVWVGLITVGAIITIFIYNIIYLAIYFAITEKQAIIVTGQDLTQVKADRVNNLRAHAKAILPSGTDVEQLANGDKPLAASISALGKAEKDLADTKEKIVKARTYLEEVKLGPWKHLLSA